MIKLFEPFQSKISLHINTGFLQSLWDKYVPVTSESYDRISLIYLKGMPGEDTKPKQQINLLVNLVLKNIYLQMNLSQNPMLLSQSAVSHSVKHLREIYFSQLRKMDFQLYQSLNQYVVYLEQAQKEEIRYQEWIRESTLITQMRREYQVLREVSERLRELTTVQSAQLERKYGKILFRSLDKGDYKILSEVFLWAQKRQVEEYIQHCSDEQYLRMIEHLGNEPSKGISRENLILLARHCEQKEFRRFCHQVLFPEIKKDEEYLRLLQGGILWKKEKREIYQQFEQMKAEEMHHFWQEIPVLTSRVCQMQEDMLKEWDVVHLENLRQEEQKKEIENSQQERKNIYSDNLQQEKESRLRYHVCQKFCASVEKIQKKYVSDLKECIQNNVLCPEKQDEYEMVHSVITDKTEEIITENTSIWKHIDYMQQTLSRHLSEYEQRIVRMEQHMLEKYVETYRQQYGITNLSETMIQKLKSWSEVLLYFAEQKPEKKEIETERLEQQSQESMDKPEFQQLSQKSRDEAEFQQMVLQLSYYIKEQERNAKDDIEDINTEAVQSTLELLEEAMLVHREEQIRNPRIQELLQYLRQIKEEERKEFIRQMADMLIIQKNIIETDISQNKIVETDVSRKKLAKIYISETDISEKKIVDIFRQKHDKRKLSETYIQQLERWSEILLSFTKQGQEKTQEEVLREQIQASKDKADFQRLSVLLANYLDKEEKTLFVYREELLRDTKIQELLQHFRQIKAEEREEFIRQLADVIVIQKQIMQETISEIRQAENSQYKDENILEKKFLLKYKEHTPSRTLIQKLESWGSAFLNVTKEEPRTQTEYLRQQIQASKDKTDFQRLEVQLTHYLDKEEELVKVYSEAETEVMPSAKDRIGTASFVYREEQLRDVKIQELLQHFRQVKEEERQEFISQLADMMIIQKRILSPIATNTPQKPLSRQLERWCDALLHFTETEQKTQTEYLQKQFQTSKDKTDFQRLTAELTHYLDEENVEVISDSRMDIFPPKKRISETFLFVYREEQLQDARIQELLQYVRPMKEDKRKEFVRQLADMMILQKREYPEMAHRIQRYEEQRKQTRIMDRNRIKTAYQEIVETFLQSEDNNVREREQLQLLSVYPGRIEHQDINYVFPEETLSVRKQKSKVDTQNETQQVKSLQQQMDIRLREVERQLQKKTASHFRTGEDVRTIAEKVKKQLHEELHMERLRRGLV